MYHSKFHEHDPGLYKYMIMFMNARDLLNCIIDNELYLMKLLQNGYIEVLPVSSEELKERYENLYCDYSKCIDLLSSIEGSLGSELDFVFKDNSETDKLIQQINELRKIYEDVEMLYSHLCREYELSCLLGNHPGSYGILHWAKEYCMMVERYFDDKHKLCALLEQFFYEIEHYEELVLTMSCVYAPPELMGIKDSKIK